MRANSIFALIPRRHDSFRLYLNTTQTCRHPQAHYSMDSDDQIVKSKSNTKRTKEPRRKPQSFGSKSQSGKLRGLEKDSPEVRLSKTLSWLLRHGAKSEGLSMRADGYVRVVDLVRML